jgi:hypothetical protein
MMIAMPGRDQGDPCNEKKQSTNTKRLCPEGSFRFGNGGIGGFQLEISGGEEYRTGGKER